MCLNPRWAYQAKEKTFNILTKKVNTKKLLFRTKVDKKHDKAIMIKCRQCEDCIAERAREWSVRGWAENKEWTEKIYLTLSYNPENLPKTTKKNPTLKKEDVTKFKKRLRKHLDGKKIKTMECGEYGEKKGRPHYHMIIWGWTPGDLKKFKKNKNGDWLYTSATTEKLWGKGFIVAGKITPKSIAYVARYTRKKVEEKKRISDDKNREEPFFNMSRRKGIGLEYWEKNKEKLKENKNMVIHDGKEVKTVKLPTIYVKKWTEEENAQAQNIINRVLKKFDDEIKRIETFKKTSLKEIHEIEKRFKKIGKVIGLKTERKIRIASMVNDLNKKAGPTIRNIMNCDLLCKKHFDETKSEKYKKWLKEEAKKKYEERRAKTDLTEKEFERHEKRLKVERLKKLKRGDCENE